MIQTVVRTRLSPLCRFGAARGAGCGAHWLSTAGWVVGRQWHCVCVWVCVLPHVSVCVCVLYSRCGRAEESLGSGESVRIIWVELIRQVSLSYFYFFFLPRHHIFKTFVSALRNFFFKSSSGLKLVSADVVQHWEHPAVGRKVSWEQSLSYKLLLFFFKIFSFMPNFEVFHSTYSVSCRALRTY